MKLLVLSIGLLCLHAVLCQDEENAQVNAGFNVGVGADFDSSFQSQSGVRPGLSEGGVRPNFQGWMAESGSQGGRPGNMGMGPSSQDGRLTGQMTGSGSQGFRPSMQGMGPGGQPSRPGRPGMGPGGPGMGPGGPGMRPGGPGMGPGGPGMGPGGQHARPNRPWNAAGALNGNRPDSEASFSASTGAELPQADFQTNVNMRI